MDSQSQIISQLREKINSIDTKYTPLIHEMTIKLNDLYNQQSSESKSLRIKLKYHLKKQSHITTINKMLNRINELSDNNECDVVSGQWTLLQHVFVGYRYTIYYFNDITLQCNIISNYVGQYLSDNKDDVICDIREAYLIASSNDLTNHEKIQILNKILTPFII